MGAEKLASEQELMIEKEIARHRRDRQAAHEVETFKNVFRTSPNTSLHENAKSIVAKDQVLKKYGFGEIKHFLSDLEPWKIEKIGDTQVAIIKSSIPKEEGIFLARIVASTDGKIQAVVREGLICAPTPAMAMNLWRKIAIQEGLIPPTSQAR